jgi:hypothetical protein
VPRYPKGYKATQLRDEVEKVLKAAVWSVAERVAVEVEAEMPEILHAVQGRAADRMDAAYQHAMADETGTLNKSIMIQENPAPAIVNSRVEVSRDTKYHSRWRTPNARTRMTITGRAIDTRSLDSVPDRTRADVLEVEIALPVLTTRRGANNMIARMGNRLRGRNPDFNLVYIKPIRIHGRTERRNTMIPVGKDGRKRVMGTWRLWRALEYGHVGGGYYGRVWIRQVTSFETYKTLDFGSRGGGTGTRVLAKKKTVQLGDWVVFMTPRIEWWARMAANLGEEWIRVESPGMAYSGGEHPIQNAILESQGEVKEKMDIAIRRALMK